MAHFYGTLQGARGQASRLGSKRSGLTVTAQTWHGSLTLTLWHDDETGQDMFTLQACEGSGRGGREVMSGKVSDLASDVAKRWSA